MKVGNFVFGQVRNSSGLHGSLQSGMALDAYGSDRPLEFKAVETGKMGGAFGVGTQGEGFHLYCDCGLDVIYVHCKYNGDKRVNRGDTITHSVLSHIHISARFNGIWNPIWCYTDPKEVTYTSEAPAFRVYPYNTLPKYQDLDASTGKLIINNKSMQITGKFHANLNGGIWNIRSLPNTTAPIMGKTTPNEEFDSTIIETQGELANSTTCWIKKGEGWVNGGGLVSCASSGDDTQCQADLATEKTKNAQLTTQVDTLTKEVNSFTLDVPRYIKK